MKPKDRKALIKKIEKYYKEHIGKSLYFYPLAVLYYQQNEKEKAYQVLLEGLQHYPRYVLALIKIAEILIEDEKYEAALAYLETASSIQRYNTKALKYLALSYEKLNRYEDALEVYKKILSIDPSNDEAKSKVVELAPMVKPDVDDIDKLIEDVAESDLKVDDEAMADDNGDAVASEGSDETDSSEISVDNIPTVNLEDELDENDNINEDEASVTLAKLYEKQGYIDEAIEIYRKVLEKEPDNMEAKEAINRLESAGKSNEENS